ncbi:hypothetical protein ACROYT_G028020 [Oculina patagonica]
MLMINDDDDDYSAVVDDDDDDGVDDDDDDDDDNDSRDGSGDVEDGGGGDCVDDGDIPLPTNSGMCNNVWDNSVQLGYFSSFVELPLIEMRRCYGSRTDHGESGYSRFVGEPTRRHDHLPEAQTLIGKIQASTNVMPISWSYWEDLKLFIEHSPKVIEDTDSADAELDMFECSEPGCIKSFTTFTELESHFVIGDHCMKDERKTKHCTIREGWLTNNQVQGFLSRLAAARRRKQEPGEVDLSPRELLLEEEEADRQQLVEDVVNELRPQHPLSYDTFNLCECAREQKLNKFNVPMLKEILRHFEVQFKSKDKKKDLIEQLRLFIQECECFQD